MKLSMKASGEYGPRSGRGVFLEAETDDDKDFILKLTAQFGQVEDEWGNVFHYGMFNIESGTSLFIGESLEPRPQRGEHTWLQEIKDRVKKGVHDVATDSQ